MSPEPTSIQDDDRAIYHLTTLGAHHIRRRETTSASRTVSNSGKLLRRSGAPLTDQHW